MSITLENGRINLDSLVTIEDHLRGLALANRTLDSIKDQLSKRSNKNSDWYRRATVAHKSWFWARSRICEQLKSQVSKEIFSECMRRAKIKNEQRLEQDFRAAMIEVGNEQCYSVSS